MEVESTTIDRTRHRPLRRTRAVIGLLLLRTTNNSDQNSNSSSLAVAFTTPQQQRISSSCSLSSSLFATHRSSSNNNEQRGTNNNSKKRKSTELEVSQQWLQGIGEATYNNTIISNAELPRGFSFADDDEDNDEGALADSSGYGDSSEEQSYEAVGENLQQGTTISDITHSPAPPTMATNGATSEEYTINISKYYINDDNYDGDHYDNMDYAEIDGSLIGTLNCVCFFFIAYGLGAGLRERGMDCLV